MQPFIVLPKNQVSILVKHIHKHSFKLKPRKHTKLTKQRTTDKHPFIVPLFELVPKSID